MVGMVTEELYMAAIYLLLKAAQRDSGQSGRCAQVLLSAFDGDDFQLSICALYWLDADLYNAAITVIRGRSELGLSPHRFVEDGDNVFENLCLRWQGLHVKNRGKVHCPHCDGRGVIYRNFDDEEAVPCDYCEETGRVCRCKA